MRMKFSKRLLAASVSALVLFLGPVPQDPTWQDGFAGIPQAHAAGGKGGGHMGGASGGGGGGHDSGTDHDHTDHDSTETDHTDHTDHDDGGHESGGKGKGPKYRGGRIGSTKGRGGPSQAVIELIFESE